MSVTVRIVIDTNALISGLFWHGAPHSLLAKVRHGIIRLVSSPALLAELADVISRPKFDAFLIRASVSRQLILDQMRRLVEIVDPPSLSAPVCRDPDDDAVLALAFEGAVDLIVSGDDDLLALGSYQGILIVTPNQALQHIAEVL